MRRSVRRRLVVASVVTALLAGGVVGVAYAGNFVSESDFDFDCDGVRDTVLGDSVREVNGHPSAGSITVTYSTSGAAHTVTQDSEGVPGSAEDGDHFGYSYTSYDQDADGCDDLVVGAVGEDVGSIEDAGMVWVVPGSATGLDTSRSTGYTQDSEGFPGGAETSDGFGARLAAGTTDIGEPFLLIVSDEENERAGAVHYVRPDVIAMITQDSPGVPGTAEPMDFFGWSVSVSDRYFVIGSAIEDVSGQASAGMVHVFSHSLTSGRPTALAGITQNTSGVSGTAEIGDRFGYSVSVLPYQQSSAGPVSALVAIGSSDETIDGKRAAGMAHLLSVSSGGEIRQVAAATQNTAGVTGGAETEDFLGHGTVLANLDPATDIATPEAAVWAVSAMGEHTASGEWSAVHVFPPGWQPGNQDIWLEDGTNGLSPESLSNISLLRASSSHLHVGNEVGKCHAVPWPNLLSAGDDQPAVHRADGCR